MLETATILLLANHRARDRRNEAIRHYVLKYRKTSYPDKSLGSVVLPACCDNYSMRKAIGNNAS